MSLKEIASLLKEASDLEERKNSLDSLKDALDTEGSMKVELKIYDYAGLNISVGKDTGLQIISVLEPIFNVDLKVKEVRDQLAKLDQPGKMSFREACPIITPDGGGMFNVQYDDVLGYVAQFPTHLKHQTDNFSTKDEAWAYLEKMYRLEEARTGTLKQGYYRVRQDGADNWVVSYYTKGWTWLIPGDPDEKSWDYWYEIGDRIDL